MSKNTKLLRLVYSAVVISIWFLLVVGQLSIGLFLMF